MGIFGYHISTYSDGEFCVLSSSSSSSSSRITSRSVWPSMPPKQVTVEQLQEELDAAKKAVSSLTTSVKHSD